MDRCVFQVSLVYIAEFQASQGYIKRLYLKNKKLPLTGQATLPHLCPLCTLPAQ